MSVVVGCQRASATKASGSDIAATIVTLMPWSFGNTVWAVHHKLPSGTADDGTNDRAAKRPGDVDFVYFSFWVGSALPTSNTNTTAQYTPRIAPLPHHRQCRSAHNCGEPARW